MLLLFKPRDKKYIGEGTIPFGTFDDTGKWEPITRYLEKGAEMFPDKTMFRMADRNGNLVDNYTYKETNDWANQVANGLIKDYEISKGDRIGIYIEASAIVKFEHTGHQVRHGMISKIFG